MTWVRLDDGFPEHPKVSGLTDRAFRLHITALCYSARNLTDGVVTRKALRFVGANANVSRPATTAKDLVTAGLWVAEGDQYRIHDYLTYNPSKQDVERDRAAARERMAARRSGKVREYVRENSSPERSGTPSRPDPTTELQRSSGGEPLLAKPPPDSTDVPPAATPTSSPEHTNGKRPAIEIAEAFIRNVGAEIPTNDLQANLRAALTEGQGHHCRYDELTDDQLVELRDLHAELAGRLTSWTATPR